MSNQPADDKTVAPNDLAALRQSLAQLRDEVRVRIHLGGMELRETFDKLDREADHLAAQVPPAATRLLNDVAARIRRVAHALDGKQ